MGLFGGLIGDFFSDKRTGTGMSVRNPWAPAAGGLSAAADIVSGALPTPLQFFPGQTYAPQTEAERQGIQSLLGGVDIWGQNVQPAFLNALSAPDVATNPYVTRIAEAIQSRVNRNLQENLLPGATMESWAAGGAPGGTAQDVAEGIALRGTSDVLAEQLAGLYGGAYQAGLGAQSRALGMAPGLIRGPAGLFGEAGALQREEAQRAIDEAMARHEFAQTEPYRRASMGSDVLLPMGRSFGETYATNTMTSTPSPFRQLGGMMSLAGMARGFFPGAGMGGFGGGYPYGMP